MRKFGKSLGVGILLCSGALLGAETVVAQWSFDDGNLVSGRYPLALRGKARLIDDAACGKVLDCAPDHARSEKGDGLTLTGKPRPELTPVEGFEWSFKLKYQKPVTAPGKNISMYLLDSEYASRCGLSLQLLLNTKNELHFRLNFGNGAKLQCFTTPAEALGNGQWHDVAVRYFDDKLAVIFDGKTVKTFYPEGKMAPSKVRLSIGDRVASTYQPFDGQLDDVKITSL